MLLATKYLNLLPIMASLLLICDSVFGSKDECLPRISNIYMNTCDVQKICLYPKRNVIIDFPCEIEDPTPGPGGDAILKVSKVRKDSVKLFLRDGNSDPTSLSVRCGDDIFVFDLVPHFSSHNDVVKIDGISRSGSCGVKVKKNKTRDPRVKTYVRKIGGKNE